MDFKPAQIAFEELAKAKEENHKTLVAFLKKLTENFTPLVPFISNSSIYLEIEKPTLFEVLFPKPSFPLNAFRVNYDKSSSYSSASGLYLLQTGDWLKVSSNKQTIISVEILIKEFDADLIIDVVMKQIKPEKILELQKNTEEILGKTEKLNAMSSILK